LIRETQQTPALSLSAYVHVLFCKVDRKSIVLSAELKTCDKSVPITALVDSGAMENFINSDLVRKHNLPTEPLPNPIIA